MEIVFFFHFDKLRVDQRVLYVAMTQDLHDVKDVSCFCVFHSCLPVAESVKVDFFKSWISQFEGYAFSLDSEVL